MTLYFWPFMDTIRAVTTNSSDITYVVTQYVSITAWMWQKLGICQQCPLPSYKIITFYSLNNYQFIFYHWHIKPIVGSCYSGIMDIWHHGGGEETILYNFWGRSLVLFRISKGNLRNSKRVSSTVCRTVLLYARNQHLLLFHWLFYGIAQ